MTTQRGLPSARALIAPFLLAALLGAPPTAGAASLSPADEACIACHDSTFAVKPLESGESLPLFVDRDEFAASVHAKGGCVSCHADSKPPGHPEGRAIVSRRQYAARRSAACRSCHKVPKGKEKTAHAYLIQKTDAPPCSVCHQPHAVRPLAEWREATSVTRYCLDCHFRDIRVSLPSDETVIPAAGAAAVWQSAHMNHECHDCHAGFSKQEHPLRVFANRRAHAEKLSEGCRACHPKQYDLAEGSIHAAAAKVGTARMPICTDCHGSHEVKHKAAFEVLAGVPCQQCHRAVFDAFGSSVHNPGLARPGHTSAPLCSDCHHAHGVASLGLREQMSRACIGCHTGTAGRHARWLPSAEQHFKAVTCPACHVPSARRRVDIKFIDQERKQPVSLDEVKRLIGPELARRIDEMEEGSESIAVWAILRELNRAGAAGKRTFTIQLDALSGAEAHRIASKTVALRECGECHKADRQKIEELFLKR
jgi:predicted CXXCH cytochrome family protein